MRRAHRCVELALVGASISAAHGRAPIIALPAALWAPIRAPLVRVWGILTLQRRPLGLALFQKSADAFFEVLRGARLSIRRNG